MNQVFFPHNPRNVIPLTDISPTPLAIIKFGEPAKFDEFTEIFQVVERVDSIIIIRENDKYKDLWYFLNRQRKSKNGIRLGCILYRETVTAQQIFYYDRKGTFITMESGIIDI